MSWLDPRSEKVAPQPLSGVVHWRRSFSRLKLIAGIVLGSIQDSCLSVTFAQDGFTTMRHTRKNAQCHCCPDGKSWIDPRWLCDLHVTRYLRWAVGGLLGQQASNHGRVLDRSKTHGVMPKSQAYARPDLADVEGWLLRTTRSMRLRRRSWIDPRPRWLRSSG